MRPVKSPLPTSTLSDQTKESSSTRTARTWRRLLTRSRVLTCVATSCVLTQLLPDHHPRWLHLPCHVAQALHMDAAATTTTHPMARLLVAHGVATAVAGAATITTMATTVDTDHHHHHEAAAGTTAADMTEAATMAAAAVEAATTVEATIAAETDDHHRHLGTMTDTRDDTTMTAAAVARTARPLDQGATIEALAHHDALRLTEVRSRPFLISKISLPYPLLPVHRIKCQCRESACVCSFSRVCVRM